MNIYVVCYKQSYTNDDGTKVVESGVCDVGYTKEIDAIQKVQDLSHEHFNDHLDELDELLDKDEDEVMEDETIYCDSNDNGDWACFHYYTDTYEYFVRSVVV